MLSRKNCALHLQTSRFSSVLFGLYCYCSLCWIYASCFVVILVCMLSKSLNIDLWDLILTYGKYFLPLFLTPVCRWKWGIRLFFVYFDPFLFLLISLIPACFFRPHFSGPKSNLLCLKTDRLLNWPYVVLVILIFRKENYHTFHTFRIFFPKFSYIFILLGIFFTKLSYFFILFWQRIVILS